MDFTNAAILAAAAYGAVFLVLVVIASIATGGDQDRIPAWVKVLVCVAVSTGVVLLVANGEWGSTQLVDGRRLDQVSFGGLLLVGLFLSFLESAGFLGFEKLLDGLRNTGQNQLTDVQRQALDAGAQRLVNATLTPTAGGSHPDATPASSPGPDLTTLPSTITPPTI